MPPLVPPSATAHSCVFGCVPVWLCGCCFCGLIGGVSPLCGKLCHSAQTVMTSARAPVPSLGEAQLFGTAQLRATHRLWRAALAASALPWQRHTGEPQPAHRLPPKRRYARLSLRTVDRRKFCTLPASPASVALLSWRAGTTLCAPQFVFGDPCPMPKAPVDLQGTTVNRFSTRSQGE